MRGSDYHYDDYCRFCLQAPCKEGAPNDVAAHRHYEDYDPEDCIEDWIERRIGRQIEHARAIAANSNGVHPEIVALVELVLQCERVRDYDKLLDAVDSLSEALDRYR